MVTLGVEEEYLLLDPASGLPVPMSRQVRTAAHLAPTADKGEVTPELLQAQVEVATPICNDLDEVTEHLVRLRGVVSAAAAEAGCRAAACGAAAMRGTLPVPVTGKARYLAMSGDAPQLVDEQLINGMHVHVAVPDRESAVAALNQIRPWLPVLVALGANSPLWDGRDTGFSSWRTVIFGRWPVSGPPPSSPTPPTTPGAPGPWWRPRRSATWASCTGWRACPRPSRPSKYAPSTSNCGSRTP